MENRDIITEIRGFNRFYTNILGLLDQHILDSGYSLTESRIIFEISKTERCTANHLCSILDIDRSYMSRIIRKFEKNALIQRNVDVEDNRNMEICLTQAGMDLFHELNERSNQQIQNILDKLNAEECNQMLGAMRTVKKFITIATEELQIRQFSEKDIRYVIDRQLSLYESERKFTSDIWKEYLTKGVLTLIERFDEEKDCMYILDCNGISSGCIAITHIEEKTAQLRYFFIEPELRELGAGKKLLDKALDF